MPTNDERREIAARLREKYGEQFGMFVPQAMEMQACNMLENLLDCLPKRRDMFLDLADLIEPEPERTCAFTDNWNDPDLPLPTCSACGWEAEETDCVCVIGGPMFQYGGKFCKECGAKVVSE